LAGLGYSLVHLLRLGSGGELGEPTEWLYGLAAVAAAAGVALAVQRGAEASDRERAQLRRRTREQSVRDSLTAAVNRAGLDLVAVPMIEQARRSGQAVSCLYADVDGLRRVNEMVGLSGGDEVLQVVARAVRECVRTTDVVCRWTGDEFVVVGPGTGMSPLELERRVRASLLQEAPTATRVWGGRVSIGSATLVPWDSGDLSSLVDRAEKDMLLRRSLRRQGQDPASPVNRRRGPGGPQRHPGARA
jgi:diguanylate cyclase (GGDEF)-like protein